MLRGVMYIISMYMLCTGQRKHTSSQCHMYMSLEDSGWTRDLWTFPQQPDTYLFAFSCGILFEIMYNPT